MIWNRVKFEATKDDFIDERRKALKTENMEKWRGIFLKIQEADEECLHDVLEEILDRVGLIEKEF